MTSSVRIEHSILLPTVRAGVGRLNCNGLKFCHRVPFKSAFIENQRPSCRTQETHLTGKDGFTCPSVIFHVMNAGDHTWTFLRRGKGVAFFAIFCFGFLCALTLAQSFRGEAVPVAQRAVPVEFSRLRFLTFVFGHEGPMDSPLTSSPVTGREYFVEADLDGIESAASIRFELLDANGRSLQPLTMWKASDGSSDGEFYGFVTVPSQPFRAAISGTTVNGAPLRAVLGDLFQPATNGPADTQVFPPGIPANQARQLQEMVNAYGQQMRARSAQAAAEHPGGVIVFARTQVSPIAYEPLLSQSGTSIGMRLRYSIRFPARQTITAVPHVFPVYSDFALRGMVAMKPLTGTITPFHKWSAFSRCRTLSFIRPRRRIRLVSLTPSPST